MTEFLSVYLGGLVILLVVMAVLWIASTDFQRSLRSLDLQRATSISPLERLSHRLVEIVNERQNAFA